MTMKKMISLALAACMALALAAPVAAATVPKQEEVALINTTVESVDKEYENAGLQDTGRQITCIRLSMMWILH